MSLDHESNVREYSGALERMREHERDICASLALGRRQVSEEQMRKFAGYAAEMFSAFGLDLNTPATADTPERFIRALYDATEGYDGDPKLLKASTPNAGAGRTVTSARSSRGRSNGDCRGLAEALRQGYRLLSAQRQDSRGNDV